jgi:hypothetical protein
MRRELARKSSNLALDSGPTIHSGALRTNTLYIPSLAGNLGSRVRSRLPPPPASRLQTCVLRFATASSCTMRIDRGQLDPGAVIWPAPGEWHPRGLKRLDEEELADWRAGRNALYQLAALTIDARLAVADG